MSQRLQVRRDANTATRRFGLGPKPGDLARIESDPRAYLLGALADPHAALISNTSELQNSTGVFASLEEARIEKAIAKAFGEKTADATKVASASPAKPSEMAGANEMIRGMADQAKAAPALAGGNPVAQVRRDALREETFARIQRAIATETPLLERLVYFWSNHFCVAITKGDVRSLAGSFEREAIRPFVLGRFADMLQAVEHHPAMLIYLDNAQSIGPNSPAGIGRDKGLNENLAREILELHTLGVDGGYTQSDVTNFARIITGWTFGQGEMVSEADKGRFLFTPNRHEPGTFEVLGRSYPQPGRVAGESVLADLVRHPKTARHLATKFARHFVSDKAQPALIARLEKAFHDSDGNLGAMTRALIDSPEAWDTPPSKIVPPFEFTVSLARAFEPAANVGDMNRLCDVLGQPLWRVTSPKGWPDDDDSWMGPSPIRERLRIAERVARDIKGTSDPREVLNDLVGAAVSENTKLAVARAETRQQAFELMIMSPEFMRR